MREIKCLIWDLEFEKMIKPDALYLEYPNDLHYGIRADNLEAQIEFIPDEDYCCENNIDNSNFIINK